MKRQITLLGGQIVPVYLGIVERSPDEVHVLFTKETKGQLVLLEKNLPVKKIHSFEIEPYDYESIKSKVEEIIFANDKDEFELNLTSGTKIMAIASQQVFNELKLPIIYIDQKHDLLNISSKTTDLGAVKLNIETFLKISGHPKFKMGALSDFTGAEVKLAEFISNQMNTGWYWKAFGEVTKKGEYVPRSKYNFKYKNVELLWDAKDLIVRIGTHSKTFSSKKAMQIAFSGLWWEILVGIAVSKWTHTHEFGMNLVIKTKAAIQLDKNEIDIVLNTGKNLVFIECKAGDVTQDDINKMKAISGLYGGVSARSILVSRKKPSVTVLEKCSEFGIDVFFKENPERVKKTGQIIHKFNNLNQLPSVLDVLITKLHL
jgi:hypothetical protein